MNDATAKVDMWSLGVIFYQLLTSKHPFIKNDAWQTFYAIKDLPIKALPSSISLTSKKIIEMLLEKDP